jgi:hypothetical protein
MVNTTVVRVHEGEGEHAGAVAPAEVQLQAVAAEPGDTADPANENATEQPGAAVPVSVPPQPQLKKRWVSTCCFRFSLVVFILFYLESVSQYWCLASLFWLFLIWNSTAAFHCPGIAFPFMIRAYVWNGASKDQAVGLAAGLPWLFGVLCSFGIVLFRVMFEDRTHERTLLNFRFRRATEPSAVRLPRHPKLMSPRCGQHSNKCPEDAELSSVEARARKENWWVGRKTRTHLLAAAAALLTPCPSEGVTEWDRRS